MDTARRIKEFSECQSFQKLEELADILGSTGSPIVISPLIGRLGGDRVQEDPDVEDAVCGALVKLGVMEVLGNLSFRFKAQRLLAKDAQEAINRFRAMLPSRYFSQSA